jgi:prevent-host-death family protein
MESVSVSELKAKLSRYLREVRRGGEVQVLDRGRPIARLVGMPTGDGPDDEHRERLIASGLLRPATSSVRDVLALPPLELDLDLGDALAEDREDRW